MNRAFRQTPVLLIAAAVILAMAPTEARAFAAYSEFNLDNGLRVILIEHRANPMVCSSVLVGAGVVHEPEGMNGASHLLEHLLFNGTESRTQRQLYDQVDRTGAYNNATTREDHTLFTLLIQREFVEQGLDIQADMLFRSTIPSENYEKEKQIILEEMARDESDPATRADLSFRRFAYAGTPLSRPVLGTKDSIAAIKRDDVWAYYKARYTPSNMVLVVMGDFDTPKMMATVRKTFGAAGSAPVPQPAPGAWPAPPEKNLRTAALEAPRLYLQAAFPLELSPHDPLIPAVELLLEALAGGQEAPLVRELTSGADPMALSASLGLALRAAPWTTVEFDAIVPQGRPTEPVLERLATGLRSLGRGGAARGAIELARSRAHAEEILGADQIRDFVMMRSAGLLGSPTGYLESSADRLDTVTERSLDEAADVLARGLERIRVSVSGPGLTEAESSWRPPALAEPRGEAAGRSLSERLPNGLQAILERNDDSQVFALHLMFRPRTASEPPGKEGIAAFLHRLYARGTVTQDAAALSARLAALGARIKTDDDPAIPYDDYYTTPEFSFVRLEMPARRWREGVALLGELVRFPRFDREEVEAVRKEILDIQKRRQDSSRNRALELMDRTLAPGHPLSRPVLGSASSVSGITQNDLRAFHKTYVTGKRMILTGVSPADPAELLEAVRAAFGGIPAGSELATSKPAPLTSRNLTARAQGQSKQSTIALSYLFDAAPGELPALAVAGTILSDKLTFDLREQKGLAYSMGASIQPWAGRVRLQVVMGTRRENVDKALAALREGITALSQPTEDEVRKAAAAMRGRLLMRRLTRVNMAYTLGLEAMEGRPAGEELKRLDALLGVEAAAVGAAIGKHVSSERCATVVAD